MLIRALSGVLLMLAAGMLVGPDRRGHPGQRRVSGVLSRPGPRWSPGGRSATRSLPTPEVGAFLRTGASGVALLVPTAPRWSQLPSRISRWWRPDPVAPHASAAVPYGRTLRGAGVLLPAVAALLLAGPVAAVLVGVAGIGLARAVLRSRERRLRQGEEAATVEAVCALAAELRAGQHPVQALRVAAEAVPGVPGLSAAAAAGAWGGDIGLALGATGGAGSAPCLHVLAAAWRAAEASGAGLADVLSSAEAEVRSSAALRAEINSELAGARATAGVLAMLPLLGIVLGAGLGARPLHMLLHTPLGAACTSAGLAFEWAGLAWTGRLVRSATPPVSAS